jgi:hypothetical protein
MTPQDKPDAEEQPPKERETSRTDEFRQTLRDYIEDQRALLETLRKRLLH